MTPEVSGTEAGLAGEAASGTSLLLSAAAGVVLGAGEAGSVSSLLLAAAAGAGVVALEAEREISGAKPAGSAIRIPGSRRGWPEKPDSASPVRDVCGSESVGHGLVWVVVEVETD
jgi:hypothetical protein